MGAHQRARAPASLRPDTSRTRCTHRISPARRVRLTDEADRAAASCSQHAIHPMWGAAPVMGRCTRCGALHPMWGTAPDVGHCTRCGALHPMWGATPVQKRCNAYGSGAAPLSTSIFADVQSHQSSADEHTTTPHKRYTRYGALHPMWGATPDVGRCTRCGALHPMWGATPDQKRCNAYRSGAAPNATSTFVDAHYPPDSASAHLPP